MSEGKSLPSAPPPGESGQPGKTKHEVGTMGYIGMAIGGGCLFVAGVSCFNVAFDLNLALGSYGSSTPLPDSWDVVAGLAVMGLLIMGLSYFGSFVLGKFKAAKGKPLVRVGIIAGAVGLLAVAGRAIQVVALVGTYGSMLAYYATDGDLEDVKAELAKDPSAKDLDDAMGRSAQYDNVGALKLLLEAGANFQDANSEYKHCVLASQVGVAYMEVAIEAGANATNCPDSEHLIWTVVDRGTNDAETAKKVELLVGAGWSLTATPDYSEESALAVAVREQKPATIKALQAAGAT